MGIDHHGHPREVLGRRPHHGGSADVDVLDQLRLAHSTLLGDILERIEVHHDEVDRFDAELLDGPHVVRHPAVGQDAAVDRGVEGLDPSVHDLREAGDLGHGRDRYPLVGQKAVGPPRRDQLDAQLHEPAGERLEVPLVRDGDKRAAHLHQLPRFGVVGLSSHAHPARPGIRRGDAPTRDEFDHPGQHAVLQCVDARGQARGRVVVVDGQGLLADDGTGVGAFVHVVHGDSGHLDPVAQRVTDAVGARETRKEGRVQVDDPVREAGEECRRDDLHEAGQHHQVGSRPAR